MSVTDRAFIRAYSLDKAEKMPPQPHIAVSATEHPGGNRPAQEGELDNQPSAQTQPPETEDGPVTSYVPSPHIPLGGNSSWRPTQRQPLHIVTEPIDDPREVAVEPVAETDHNTQETTVRFQPALEVDAFLWPAACESLVERMGPQLEQLAQQLATQLVNSQNVLAVTGPHRSEGRSLVLLALAKTLAAGGVRTAVVDADLANPQLAAQLGVAASEGWEQVLRGRLPLAEATIFANQDGLALLPAVEPTTDAGKLVDSIQASVSLGVLRRSYDVVLVDAGPLLDSQSSTLSLLGRTGAGGAILVYDAAQSRDADLASATVALARTGVEVWGMIENHPPAAVRQYRNSAQTQQVAG